MASDIQCSDSFCTARYWQCTYKAIRSAFIKIGQINRQKEREISKVRQRVIQLCYDGRAQTDDQFLKAHFDKIRELLNQDCLMT